VSLRGWIDDDWANCPDRVTFAEKIEPDDATIGCFGHYPENRGVSDEGLDALRCDLHGREGWSKTVALGDGPKTFIADATTCVSVVIRCRSDDDVHWSYCLTERKAA
jgi:hypothetical protein